MSCGHCAASPWRGGGLQWFVQSSRDIFRVFGTFLGQDGWGDASGVMCVCQPNERWLCFPGPNERWDHFWDKRGPCSRHHPVCEAIFRTISLFQTFSSDACVTINCPGVLYLFVGFSGCSNMQISLKWHLAILNIFTSELDFGSGGTLIGIYMKKSDLGAFKV